MGNGALRDAGGVYHQERWTIGDPALTPPSPQSGVAAVVVSEPEWKEALAWLSGRVLEEDADAFRVRELLAKEDAAFVVGVAVWAKTPFEAWWAV